MLLVAWLLTSRIVAQRDYRSAHHFPCHATGRVSGEHHCVRAHGPQAGSKAQRTGGQGQFLLLLVLATHACRQVTVNTGTFSHWLILVTKHAKTMSRAIACLVGGQMV